MATRTRVGDVAAVFAGGRGLIALVLIAGCAHSSFQDCAVSCTAATGCPDGLACGAEGYCRAEGATGSCAGLVPDGSVDAPIAVTETFEYVGATRQTYVVPAGFSSLHIIARGASGGDTGTFLGGRGAIVDTVAPVTSGETLAIVVGGHPDDQPAGMDGCGASGGGGSFVVRTGNVVLAVAGGGGGASGYQPIEGAGGPANLTEDGGSSTLAGGTNGMGGSADINEGGGGGGMTGDGADGVGLGGESFVNGSRGGARASTEMCGTASRGGFGGGGGGGKDGGGGGGGYSGGAGRSESTTASLSGGGGSMGLGTPNITRSTTRGHGSIVITPQ